MALVRIHAGDDFNVVIPLESIATGMTHSDYLDIRADLLDRHNGIRARFSKLEAIGFNQWIQEADDESTLNVVVPIDNSITEGLEIGDFYLKVSFVFTDSFLADGERKESDSQPVFLIVPDKDPTDNLSEMTFYYGIGGYVDDTAIHTDEADEFSDITEKTIFADDDKILGEDSEDSGAKKIWLWSTIKSQLKTYFDTLYSSASGIFDYISFNTDYEETGSEPIGSLKWNQDEETLDLKVSDDVMGQLLQELIPPVINQTGSTITNGTPVMYAGTLGASGQVLVTPAIADGTYPSAYMAGVATEDIANGAKGKVTWFGKVRGIDTTGTPYGETWADGNLIYVSTTAGYLTNTKPESPYKHIPVGVVIYAGSNGTLFVRPSWYGKLNDLDDVNSNASTTGDLITYNATTQRYEVNYNILNFLQSSAIGNTVQSYNANTVIDADYATDKARLADTSGENTGDQDLSSYALKSNVLELDNTTEFTPDSDYEPATKKYVDDNAGSGESGATADVTVTWTSAKTATSILAELNALPKNDNGYARKLIIDDLTVDIDTQMTFEGLSNLNMFIEATTAVGSAGLSQNAELNFNSANNIKFLNCFGTVQIGSVLTTLTAGNTTLPFSVDGGHVTISTKYCGFDLSAITSEAYIFKVIGGKLISNDDTFKGSSSYNTSLAYMNDSLDAGRGSLIEVYDATYDTTKLTYAAKGRGLISFGGTNDAFTNDTANGAIDISQLGDETSPIRVIVQSPISISTDGETTDIPLDDTSKIFKFADTVAAQTFTVSNLNDTEEHTKKITFDNSLNSEDVEVTWPSSVRTFTLPNIIPSGITFVVEFTVESSTIVHAKVVDKVIPYRLTGNATALAFDFQYQVGEVRTLAANVSFTKGTVEFGNGAYYKETIESNGTYDIGFSDDFIEFRNDYENENGIYELHCVLQEDGKIRYSIILIEAYIEPGVLTFDTLQDITRTGNSYFSNGSLTSAWALSNYYLPASTDGYIDVTVEQISGTDYGYPIVIGFSDTQALQSYGDFIYAVYLPSLIVGPRPQYNGSGSTSYGTTLAYDTIIRLSRESGVFKLYESVGGGAFTLIYTFTTPDTSLFYIVMNMNTGAALATPEFGGGITL